MQLKNLEVLEVTPLAIGRGFTVEIQAVVDDVKMKYMVVSRLEGLTIRLGDVGFKTSRKKNYTYIDKLIKNDTRYRNSTTEQRREIHQNTLRELIPSEVVQVALGTVAKSFVAENF